MSLCQDPPPGPERGLQLQPATRVHGVRQRDLVHAEPGGVHGGQVAVKRRADLELVLEVVRGVAPQIEALLTPHVPHLRPRESPERERTPQIMSSSAPFTRMFS